MNKLQLPKNRINRLQQEIVLLEKHRDRRKSEYHSLWTLIRNKRKEAKQLERYISELHKNLNLIRRALGTEEIKLKKLTEYKKQDHRKS